MLHFISFFILRLGNASRCIGVICGINYKRQLVEDCSTITTTLLKQKVSSLMSVVAYMPTVEATTPLYIRSIMISRISHIYIQQVPSSVHQIQTAHMSDNLL